MVNSWEPLYSENYMKSKKANKKFDFKVFTETGPKTSLITDVRVSNVGHALHETDMVAMMRRAHGHCYDPAFVTFSVLSLTMHFHGWLSFFITLYYKLPLKQDRTGYYEYVGFSSCLAMLLEIYDFPPYGGYFDAHSIWHLATVPLTILWWSFIRDDAEFRTSSLLKKSKTKA
uniref:Post-GPI attachment to proteins factor 3 n=1 Tax=Brassica oleracea var. oleracea TaxID=109376 RepID=A0A0D3BDN5_BRAOL